MNLSIDLGKRRKYIFF